MPITPDFGTPFGYSLGNLPLLRNAQTRSISAENPTGAKGQGGRATTGTGATLARQLGVGWKVSPSIILGPGDVTIADIQGPGVIQHIWMTTSIVNWRRIIVKIFWDDETTPSVYAPLGDFFTQNWLTFAQVNSLCVAVNPNGGLNCYWPMPFRQRARIVLENPTPDTIGALYYQVTYALTDVPDTAAYFHAFWRRTRFVPEKQVYTIADNIVGQGQYVGTFLSLQATDGSWWGEGEIKYYLDGDTDFPTICGTGMEDYFGGAWAFKTGTEGRFQTFTTPFLGFHLLVPGTPHGDQQGRRYGMYRWHVMDPIHFASNLRVTIQDLGIGASRGGAQLYDTRQDDISSVAYWYQTEPHTPLTPAITDQTMMYLA